MQDVSVDKFVFSFPDTWQVTKYDDWNFYKKRFQQVYPRRKGLDLLVLDSTNTAWLIEAKDYRQHQRTKPSCLAEEMAIKVIDTLAALLPASVNSDQPNESDFARSLNRAVKLRVVLHLEQPLKHSRLFPRAIRPLDVPKDADRVKTHRCPLPGF